MENEQSSDIGMGHQNTVGSRGKQIIKWMGEKKAWMGFCIAITDKRGGKK